MATLSGKDGKVEIGGTELAHIHSWQLTTSSNNPARATSGTSGWKTRTAGVKDSSGSISFTLDDADPITDDFDEGSAVTLKLYLDDTRFYTVPAIIDEIAWDDVDINDGEFIGGTASFSGTAAITKPTYA